MAITENQLTTIFQNQLKRPPTPFEVKQYGDSSIQNLANLGSTYKSLNTNSSISDYLKSIGQDNSIEARTALGQKYGIPNIGTAEGNTALLAAMKKGAPPTTPTPAITGSVVAPPPQQTSIVPTNNTPAPQTTPQIPGTLAGNGIPQTDANGNVTVNGVPIPITKYDQFGVPIDPNNPNSADNQTKTADQASSSDPTVQSQQIVDSAYQRQQQAQKAVADIDNTISNVLRDKMAEIARSGGVVNEASLRSEVLRENAPLLEQRKQLVAEYTQANQDYQKAVSDKRSSDANSFKEQSLQQGQEKIDVQQSQFTQKLEQSGYKQSKVNVYDDYGNVVGQKVIWSQNPASGSGFDSDGNAVSVTQGSQGPGVSSTPTQSLSAAQNNYGALKYTAYTASLGAKDSGIIDPTDGSHFAAFSTPEEGKNAQISLLKSSTYSNMTVDDAMKKYSNGGYGAEVAPGIDGSAKMKDLSSDQLNQLATDIQTREGVSGSSAIPTTSPLYTGSSVNATSPGYTTATVKFGGKDTQLTQSYIDKIAIAAIMNGGTIPSSAARGTKGLPIVQTDAIKARIGQLDPGGNLVANKEQAQAWGSALSSQIDYATKITRSLNSADQQFQQILSKYQDTGINQDNAPISNWLSNAAKYNLGNADVAAFRSSLAELSRQYSQVFSSGGQTTDATNKTAQDILNGNMSMKQLQAVQSQLQALGKIDVQQANDSINGTVQNLSNIANGGSISTGSGTPKGSTSSNDYVNQILTSQGYKYDDFIKQVPQGKIPVIQNSDGTIGYLDNDSEYDASTYTRI